MADPSIQTFCCHKPGSENSSIAAMFEFNSRSYNIVCLVSSLFGIAGAIYQLLPRIDKASQRWFSSSTLRSRQIIIWLAVADLLASLGVFMRSIAKLNETMWIQMGLPGNIIFCIILAAWIQYFFVVTWLWTLCYAIDMWLALRHKPGYFKLYHTLSWTLPAILTTTGLAILYLPDVNCHNLEPGASTFLRLLPNYFVVYVPMATVMLINPVLYMMSTRSVEGIVANCLSQFTRKERAIVDSVKRRFGYINIAFYVCWLPNIINGVLMWTFWSNLPDNVLIVLWYLMAVANPLQALLNCLVYRRSNQTIQSPLAWFQCFSKETAAMEAETTPLITPNINT